MAGQALTMAPRPVVYRRGVLLSAIVSSRAIRAQLLPVCKPWLMTNVRNLHLPQWSDSSRS